MTNTPLAASLAPAVSALAAAYGLVAAAVIGALAGRGLRALLLLVGADRGRGRLLFLLRVLAVAMFGALSVGLAAVLREAVAWDGRALAVAGLAAGLMIAPTLWQWARRRPVRLSLLSVLLRAVVVLAVLLLGTLTLMRVGYLALTTDRPVLLVEVTGETRPQTVRWAAPDQPLREESLVAHRVLLRAPTGELVSEAWLYGDQVAVKGRVLRLSPWLNALGLPNLFELQFAHNGYLSAERHASQPHQALPLKPLGPLTVHPRWQPLRDRLLTRWEHDTAPDSQWAIRAATTESTYFALVDGAGQPVRQTYRLVLTPGGLSGG